MIKLLYFSLLFYRRKGCGKVSSLTSILSQLRFSTNFALVSFQLDGLGRGGAVAEEVVRRGHVEVLQRVADGDQPHAQPDDAIIQRSLQGSEGPSGFKESAR